MQLKLDTTATQSFRGHFQALKNSSDNLSSCLIAGFLFKMALVFSILGVPLNSQLSMMMEPSECFTSGKLTSPNQIIPLQYTLIHPVLL